MIEQEVLEAVLGKALAKGGDFAEVFAEDRTSMAAVLDDGRVEELSSGRERGAGVRVVAGETTGYAHTSDLSEASLLEAARAASAAARGANAGARVVALKAVAPSSPAQVAVAPESVPKADKVALLVRVDEAAHSAGAAIRQVSASYGDSRRRVLVANSEGALASDDQVRCRLSVTCVAQGDSGLQTGRESLGATAGVEMFEQWPVEDLASEAARRALVKLEARPAPSGPLSVVIKQGSGGILFHEACGHGLEADLATKDLSAFSGKSGEKVASSLVTLVDDGTMGRQWGSYAVDDEGQPARRNVLIENGVLSDYMWDWLRARKHRRDSSGNGRRESYQHLPMVRMTNTYVLAGSDDPDEIIQQTPYGVYVAQLGGGQVNTATGDFVFGMTEAYLIENGRITAPLRDANLIGNGPQVLANIDAVGWDFAMGSPGTCGKQGQGVPVGTGQPTLRVRSLTVGGTAR
jgi:TldD protein